jgi:predicted nucleic-acid-binding protein
LIGLDTNILLRLALKDDPEQTAAARRLVARCTPQEPACINLVVLAEFVWTLLKRNKINLSIVAAAVEDLLSNPSIAFDERAVVIKAVLLAKDRRLDLADALIGLVNDARGASPTATFDAEAARHSLFIAIA